MEGQTPRLHQAAPHGRGRAQPRPGSEGRAGPHTGLGEGPGRGACGSGSGRLGSSRCSGQGTSSCPHPGPSGGPACMGQVSAQPGPNSRQEACPPRLGALGGRDSLRPSED